jgi:ActR/RegA family two-component response regulator
MTPPPRNSIGRALIVSENAATTRQLTEAMQELSLSVEVCVKVSDALHRVNNGKLEVIVIDLSFGDHATLFLEQMRGSPSNRTAVLFAITSGSAETARALNAGSVFALEKPLTPDSIRHTLEAAGGLIARERRRYFRHPISCPAVLSRKGAPQVFGKTINISECGMAFATSTPLKPGEELTVQFTLSDPSLQITAECRVCWTNEIGETGLLFVFLPSTLSSELQAWLSRRLEEPPA